MDIGIGYILIGWEFRVPSFFVEYFSYFISCFIYFLSVILFAF